MGLSEFEVISGALDALLVMMGIILLVRVGILRKTLKRHKTKEESPSSTFAMASVAPPADLIEKEASFRREMERERAKFQMLIRDSERMRAEMQVLFHDIEALVDDLATMKSPPPPVAISASPSQDSGEDESGGMYILPPDKETPPSSRKVMAEDLPLKETVLSLSKAGRSIPEIAQVIGRSEGEVSFLLSMEKVGKGR